MNYKKEIAKLGEKVEDAENGLISEILDSPKEAMSQLHDLKPEHIFNGTPEKILIEVNDLQSNNELPEDTVSLMNKINNVSYSKLSHLLGQGFSTTKITDYKRVIIENWRKRQAIKKTTEFLNNIKSGDINENYTNYNQNIEEILKTGAETDGNGSIIEDLQKLEAELLEGEAKEGIQTGYNKLDSKIIGLEEGDLFTIGGRTSVGKSAFALNMVENMILRHNPVKIGYLSLEMTRKKILERLISTIIRVNSNKFRRKNATHAEHQKWREAKLLLEDKPLHITHTVSRIDQIINQIHTFSRKFDKEVIFIDNIQNILDDKNFRETIEIALNRLKTIAKKLKITIVVLSHLSRSNRKNKNGEPPEPKLRNLKEASGIEQYSDAVVLLYRPQKNNTIIEPYDSATAILAKNRHGPKGRINLRFYRKYTRYSEGKISPYQIQIEQKKVKNAGF